MEVNIKTIWTKVNGYYEILEYDVIVNGDRRYTCNDIDELIGILTQLKDEEKASSGPKS